MTSGDQKSCATSSSADRGSISRTTLIRTLNDALRQTGLGGRTMVTRGIYALPPALLAAVLQHVRDFSSFDDANDPYGEHDFGSFTIGEVRGFWKIDYYDKQLASGSPDPADAAVTTRVLTILLAEEY